MARRGFFGRISDAIRRTVAPPSRPPEPTTRIPEPSPRERKSDYREIWRETRTKRGANLDKNLAAFHAAIDRIESDPGERLYLWRSYVRNIVNGEGQYRRNDSANLFWRDSGIDPRDFNWQKWREAMGFVGKRRSRTP